jgi:hypothetical protein
MGSPSGRAAIATADERLPGTQRITLAADEGYDHSDFVASCRGAYANVKVPWRIRLGDSVMLAD